MFKFEELLSADSRALLDNVRIELVQEELAEVTPADLPVPPVVELVF